MINPGWPSGSPWIWAGYETLNFVSSFRFRLPVSIFSLAEHGRTQFPGPQTHHLVDVLFSSFGKFVGEKDWRIYSVATKKQLTFVNHTNLGSHSNFRTWKQRKTYLWIYFEPVYAIAVNATKDLKSGFLGWSGIDQTLTCLNQNESERVSNMSQCLAWWCLMVIYIVWFSDLVIIEASLNKNFKQIKANKQDIEIASFVNLLAQGVDFDGDSGGMCCDEISSNLVARQGYSSSSL